MVWTEGLLPSEILIVHLLEVVHVTDVSYIYIFAWISFRKEDDFFQKKKLCLKVWLYTQKSVSTPKPRQP